MYRTNWRRNEKRKELTDGGTNKQTDVRTKEIKWKNGCLLNMLPLLKMLINPDYGETFLIYPTFIGKPIMFVQQPFGNISIFRIVL
jgi:hypothetical protein